MSSHILLVDDEANIRDLLGQLFRRNGYRVSSVATVADALRIVAQDCPQLIITDLQLEESDGFELADQVKTIAPTVPILLLTGVLFDRDTLQTAAGDRIAGYISKTAPLAQIRDEVERLLKTGK